jgi:AcrR family transcriptional regulator
LTSLRERKRERTRQAILAAASALLARRGLRETTMEEIAARAEVAVGTLYNYFGSKTALLRALLDLQTDDMLEAGEGVVEAWGRAGAAAVGSLFGVYLGFLFKEGDRSLWRDLFQAAFGETALTAQLAGMDLRLMEQVGRLLQRLRQQGGLGPHVAVEEAALLLYSILVTHLMFYLWVESVSPADLRAQIDRQLALVFAGLSPAPTKGTR